MKGSRSYFTSVKFFFLMVSGFVVFGISLTSTYWINTGNTITPTSPGILLASVSCFVGFGTLCLLVLVAKGYFWTQEVYSFGTQYYPYKIILACFEDLRNQVDELRLCVRRNELVPRTPLFDSHINEMEMEFKGIVHRFSLSAAKSLVLKQLLIIATIILVFAGFHIADFTLERTWSNSSCVGLADIQTMVIKDGTILDRALEGIYYSSVTFATLGYGDVHLSTLPFPRCIAILEIILFVLNFGLLFNYAFYFLQAVTSSFDPHDLARALRDDLEKEVGGFKL